MKKIMLITLVALGAVAAQATSVVSLQGNYDTGTGNLNFVKPTETTSGEARINDNDFGTAIVTSGAVVAGGNYVGPTMYGAFRHSVAGGPPATIATARVASSDSLQITPSSVLTGAATFDFMFVFKKADFANGLNAGSVGFDTTSSFVVTSTVYNANTKSLRAVVQNGSTWYVSQAQNTANNGGLTILSDAYSAQWAVWDPLTSIDAATLDFSTTVAGSTFNNIQAVGIYSHQTKTAGGTSFANTLASINIGAVAVPEPATIGMLGLGAIVTLLVRRMRN